MYYAVNIKGAAANANAVTVEYSGYGQSPTKGPNVVVGQPAELVTIAEYSGIVTSSALDGTSAATGSGTSVSCGTVSTTSANDSLLGAYTGQNAISAGSGSRIHPPSEWNIEDESVSATGSYSATATEGSGGGPWVMQLAAFRATGGSVCD